MAQALMSQSDINLSFWDKAVHTTVYIIHDCLPKAVIELTFEEAFTGYKPLVFHLHVFGSEAYVHISDTI